MIAYDIFFAVIFFIKLKVMLSEAKLTELTLNYQHKISVSGSISQNCHH